MLEVLKVLEEFEELDGLYDFEVSEEFEELDGLYELDVSEELKEHWWSHWILRLRGTDNGTTSLNPIP